jgi:Fe-S cluster assembly iron-binding protein IscA
MITVTERAKMTLARLKAAAHVEDVNAVLRLSVLARYGELGLQVDQVQPDDQVVEHAGTPVLLLDEDIANALSDAIIDTQPTAHGDELVLRGNGGEPTRLPA